MRLLVIRHGESEADLLNVHEGRADFELTETGKKQAKAMAHWVRQNYAIDKIYASTLKRAKQTAQFLAEEVKIDIIFEEDLMEFNNGLLAGLSREEAKVTYPKMDHLPMHRSVYEMESMLAFRYRAEVMLSKILSENSKEDTIAIVSHGGTINQIACAFLSLPVDVKVRFSTGDTGIHCWNVTDSGRCILFSNKTDHLNGI